VVLGADYLKAMEDEHATDPRLNRQSIHDTGSGCLPEDFKVEDLLSGFPQANSPLEGGEECEDSGVRSSAVARTSN